MQKTILFLLIPFLLLRYSSLRGQDRVVSTGNSIETVQQGFLQQLKTISIDSAISQPLAEQVESQLNNIRNKIRKTSISAVEKEKAVRSLVFFLKELSLNLARGSLDMYTISGVVDLYRDVLMALLTNKPVGPVLAIAGPVRSQLVATSFSQYNQHLLLDEIAIYKRMLSVPEFILQFLEKKPGFRFADSLLLNAAADDPQRIIYYLGKDRGALQDKIRNNNNNYMRQLVLLSTDKHASELIPFVTQIADRKISPEEILTKRTIALDYFQLLVDELQGSVGMGTQGLFSQKPVRKAVKQKALAFYVNSVNELHDAAEAVRFASVKELRPQDLYYIITSCGDELYTSSYLGLYKRLMAHFPGMAADSLFENIQYDNFRVFIRLAANYNVLSDFLQRLSPDRRADILQQFIMGIEKEESTALEKAMDIADCFSAADSTGETNELINTELRSNLRRCTSGQQYLGMRLYSILLEVFDLVKQNGIKKLWETLGDYETLKRGSLENEKGEVTELVLFYGDEDGIQSFNNFQRMFANKTKWEITKNANWVSIRSLTGQLTIYANRPLDMKDGLDLAAQDSLARFLKERSLQPAVLVHRGHSYHLDKTMQQLSPSVRLAILGSCGGYNKAISIASINPDVQVIGSKKTGAGSINDPLIEEINEVLISKKDILWPELWMNLSRRFSKEGRMLSLFNEYFPPSNNLGLFVLKLYKYYSKPL